MGSSLERFPPHDCRTCGAAPSLYSPGGIGVKSHRIPHAALVRYSRSGRHLSTYRSYQFVIHVSPYNLIS